MSGLNERGSLTRTSFLQRKMGQDGYASNLSERTFSWCSLGDGQSDSESCKESKAEFAYRKWTELAAAILLVGWELSSIYWIFRLTAMNWGGLAFGAFAYRLEPEAWAQNRGLWAWRNFVDLWNSWYGSGFFWWWARSKLFDWVCVKLFFLVWFVAAERGDRAYEFDQLRPMPDACRLLSILWKRDSA